MQDEILAQMLNELDWLEQCPIAEMVIGGNTVRLREPFTAGLLAIRLYPLLWPPTGPVRGAKKILAEAIIRRLAECRPADGGGWPFFDRVYMPEENSAIELIAPDADTTAVCWSALLLAGQISVRDCEEAFHLICKNLKRDGDVYFDNSGRLDIIALCNMIFFFLLYCEKYEEENKESVEITPELMDGILRARTIIAFVLSLDSDAKVAYWLRYYVDSSASALVRVCGFVSPIVLRWPECSFVQPLKEALYSAGTRLNSKSHCSFLDACLIALAQPLSHPRIIRHPRWDEAKAGKTISIEREVIFYTAVHRMAFVSSLFSGSCFLAAVSAGQASYSGANPTAVCPSTMRLPNVINSKALMAIIKDHAVEIPMDESILSLCCSQTTDQLLNHFNQTFSSTISYHSIPDALVVSESFRVLLKRTAFHDLIQVGSRIKSCRDLLIHCLGLSKQEMESFWTKSQTRFLLSVALTCVTFRNSRLIKPIRDALLMIAKDQPVSSLNSRLVNFITTTEKTSELTAFDEIRTDEVAHAYCEAIASAITCPGHILPDDAIEASKFKSHLNYGALKKLLTMGAHPSSCISSGIPSLLPASTSMVKAKSSASASLAVA